MIPRQPPATAIAHRQRPRRRLATLAVAVALSVGLAVPAVVPSAVPAADAARASVVDDRDDALVARTVALDTWRYRKGIRRVTNRRRAEKDLAAVAMRRCLNLRAQRWAEHLAARDQFRHSDLSRTLDRCNLRLVAENLARGYTHPPATVRAWMHSPGHRANLLDRRHRLTGVGMAKGPRGWITVQLLGRG